MTSWCFWQLRSISAEMGVQNHMLIEKLHDTSTNGASWFSLNTIWAFTEIREPGVSTQLHTLPHIQPFSSVSQLG